ncbi:MAG: 5-(carboxyamino)imidazole ribonucleotide synthase [Rickettsiales bacterium]|nr:5-(carboxyamino)imidazole ribonucleotide synthase [Rickettsiales bacterium]
MLNNYSKKIAILGGGQLGMMLAKDAKKLGFQTICLTPKTKEKQPAEFICDKIIFANYDDNEALKKLAEEADFITYEFENIPYKSIEFLEKIKPTNPPAQAIFTAQNRLRERSFFRDNKLPTHRFRHCKNPQDISNAFDELKIEKAILKTSDYGYDGKGQARVSKNDDFTKIWQELNFNSIILEEFVDFDFEISVILARKNNNEIAIFPIGRNTHRDGILRVSELPINLSEKTKNQAEQTAIKIAELLNYVGVLAVEFFVLKNGDISINEIAPRVHNSGHWTQDGCNISQFEQHIRAISSLPLISPKLTCTNIRMENIIGEDIYKIAEYKKNSNAKIHLYGKNEVKKGRKLGHVNITSN